MVTFIKGDIFESSTQVLTNTVKYVSVMGKGVALEFKNRVRQMFNDCDSKCDQSIAKPAKEKISARPREL